MQTVCEFQVPYSVCVHPWLSYGCRSSLGAGQPMWLRQCLFCHAAAQSVTQILNPLDLSCIQMMYRRLKKLLKEPFNAAESNSSFQEIQE